MSCFVCLHGAGGWGSWFDLLARELAPLGHEVIGVDLPCDRDVGYDAYVDAALAAIGPRREGVVLVAHSLSGLVAPVVATRTPVELVVLLAAMVPRPGETGGEWWEALGHEEALTAQQLPDDSPETLFVHDVPPDVLAASAPPRDQSDALFAEPWPLAAWPDVRTEFLLCRDDRFFPAEWLRAAVRARLGVEPIEVPGGHCAHLSQPAALAAVLHGLVTASG